MKGVTNLLNLAIPIALLLPGSALGQEADPSSCAGAELKAPTLWIGSAITEAPIFVGPGDESERHQNSELFAGERVQVLQECGDWLHVRVVPEVMLDMIVLQSGAQEAKRMLLYWVDRDLIRSEGDE